MDYGHASFHAIITSNDSVSRHHLLVSWNYIFMAVLYSTPLKHDIITGLLLLHLHQLSKKSKPVFGVACNDHIVIIMYNEKGKQNLFILLQ